MVDLALAPQLHGPTASRALDDFAIASTNSPVRVSRAICYQHGASGGFVFVKVIRDVAFHGEFERRRAYSVALRLTFPCDADPRCKRREAARGEHQRAFLEKKEPSVKGHSLSLSLAKRRHQAWCGWRATAARRDVAGVVGAGNRHVAAGRKEEGKVPEEEEDALAVDLRGLGSLTVQWNVERSG